MMGIASAFPLRSPSFGGRGRSLKLRRTRSLHPSPARSRRHQADKSKSSLTFQAMHDRMGRLRQRREEQHSADTQQDDVLEYELAGQIPGDRIGRQTPFDDTRRREEERPCDGKSDHPHQRTDGRQDRAERACHEKRRNAKLGNAEEIRFSPDAKYRKKRNKWTIADELHNALSRL